MEVKKGKYTFVITDNIETWNGVITGINYKIGGNIDDCVNISVHFDNNIAFSASITHALYNEECSRYEPLGRGEGSIIMIKTLLMHIKKMHPELKKIKFDDMSSIECATDEDAQKNRSKTIHLRSFKTPPSGAVMSDEDSAELKADCALKMRKGVKQGTNLVPMPLYYLSIAYNGETWYEKHFHAVQQDAAKQNAYRVRVDKTLNDVTIKPKEYIDFLKITKVPMDIRLELENFYVNTKSYSEFFHLIPKQDRCRLLRPWIKEFMNYYLKGVFSSFDWEIQLSNIRGVSLSKTRKKQHKCGKKYYCPNGFNRNMNCLKDIGDNSI